VAKKLYNADAGFLASKALGLSLGEEAFLALDEVASAADSHSFFSDSSALHFRAPDNIPAALGPVLQSMPSYAMPDASHAGAAPILSDAAFVHAIESDALVFKPLDAIQATVPDAPSNGAFQPTVFPEPFAAADIFASPGLDPSGHPLPAYNSVLHDAQAPSATQAAATQAAAQAIGESPGLDRFGHPLPPYNSVLFDTHAATQAASGDTLWFI